MIATDLGKFILSLRFQIIVSMNKSFQARAPFSAAPLTNPLCPSRLWRSGRPPLPKTVLAVTQTAEVIVVDSLLAG